MFRPNLAGAVPLTAGALFLVAAPVAAQNCMRVCRCARSVECTVTPGGADCTDGRLVRDCRIP